MLYFLLLIIYSINLGKDSKKNRILVKYFQLIDMQMVAGKRIARFGTLSHTFVTIFG